MATFILSVGGSTVVPDGKVNAPFLKSLKALITKRVARGDRFVIVTGGGGTCREYQRGLKAVGKISDNDLDWLGIYTTHLNAQLVRLVFGSLAHPTVNTGNPLRFPAKSWKTPVLLSGGLEPGGSSDTNIVLFAKKLGAKDVINISNVDYLYTKDPRKFEDAEKIPAISWVDYRKMFGDKWIPGMNIPFDPRAARIAQSSKIRVALLGSDIKNLDRYLSGKPFRGSLIS